MGKRSDFERVARDFYPTPLKPVLYLNIILPLVGSLDGYVEPCAGDARLVEHIRSVTGSSPSDTFDIAPRHPSVRVGDALKYDYTGKKVITNPPWSRDFLHPFLDKILGDNARALLLFDADWAHTKQAVPYLEFCRLIQSVGRVKWFEDSKNTGKDNAAWYYFDGVPNNLNTLFMGRCE